MQVGDRISDEARRAIYPELLKRLDDSSNKVGVTVRAHHGPYRCATWQSVAQGLTVQL
jgi:hypothetical protein